MRILLCPDSFKTCLSAQDVCAALRRGILKRHKNAEVLSFPLADGGEGTLETLASVLHHKVEKILVPDAYGKPKTAQYLYFPKEKTALIESAQAVGIEGIDKNCLHTKNAGTKGVGELILDAILQKGATKIVLTLGGTATTDGGLGALSALGLRFIDKNGEILPPIGQSMAAVHAIEATPLYEKIQNTHFYFAADVRCPFYGSDGAAFVFAPQKGATEQEVATLDRGLLNLAKLYRAQLARQVEACPVAGAAGGLAGGLYAAFGGEVLDCFTLFQTLYGLDAQLQTADFVITGEGKSDAQTSLGKLPMRVQALAAAHGVPCILLSGAIDKAVDFKALGFSAAIALKTAEHTTAYAIENAAALLEKAAEALF